LNLPTTRQAVQHDDSFTRNQYLVALVGQFVLAT
jgi:hypothetical protein